MLYPFELRALGGTYPIETIALSLPHSLRGSIERPATALLLS
jgi:hypothetical protein